MFVLLCSEHTSHQVPSRAPRPIHLNLSIPAFSRNLANPPSHGGDPWLSVAFSTWNTRTAQPGKMTATAPLLGLGLNGLGVERSIK